MVQTQYGVTAKSIWSDNASKFLNWEVQSLLAKFGILHHCSCVYTPQQNGVVERKHQSILDVARALMFQSKMRAKFWPYFILTATWLLNRRPSKVLESKVHFRVLTSKTPKYESLKPFGYLVYATDLSPSRSRFDVQSVKCVLLGVGPGWSE